MPADYAQSIPEYARRAFIALCLLASGVFVAYILLAGKAFWDFDVYRAGVAAYLAHGNAYDQKYLLDNYGVGAPFFYPPFFLVLFSHADWLFTTWGGAALLLPLQVAAVVAIPFVQVPQELRRDGFAWMFCAYLVAFGLAGTKLLLTGNVAALLSAPLVITLFQGTRTGRYLPFWIVLVFACQIKVYFLILAVVPFVLDRKVVGPVVAGLAIAAFYAVEYLEYPALFHEFVAAVSRASNDAATVGHTVMTAVESLHASIAPLLAKVVALAYAALMIGFAVFISWTGRRALDRNLLAIWVFMSALLASPHLQVYEAALLVVPFIVCLRWLLMAPGLGLYIAVAAFVMAASVVTTPLTDWAGLVALIGVWAGTGVQFLGSIRASQRLLDPDMATAPLPEIPARKYVG